jgi:hypothetical protein
MGKKCSSREVTMTSSNYSLVRLANVLGSLQLFILASVFLAVFCATAVCHAQAVPPRGQALQMIRPVAPPPEPPIQKEIRDLKQEVRGNKIELERKIEAERAYRFLAARSSFYQSKLDTLLRYPFDDKRIQPAMQDVRCKASITPILRDIQNLYLRSLAKPSDQQLRADLENLIRNPFEHRIIRIRLSEMPDGLCKGQLITFLNYMRTLPIQIEQDRVRLNKPTEGVNDDHDRCR